MNDAESSGRDFLDSIGIDAGELLREQVGLTASNAVVYVAGSLVEGLGNSASDVDLFVLADPDAATGTVMKKDRFSISIQFRASRRVDFEYWPVAEVELVAHKLRDVRVGHDFVAEKLAGVQELFVHRLLHGLPLQNAKDFERVRAWFDREHFQRYLAQQAIHRIDGAMEDLCGMFNDGDLETALLRARDLAGLTCDAYGHHLGNTNTLPKWRARIASSIAQNDRHFANEFWELQLPHVARDADEAVRAYVRRCLTFAELTVQKIQR